MTRLTRHIAFTLSLMTIGLFSTAQAGKSTIYFPDGSSLTGDLRSNDEGLHYIIVGGKPLPIDISNLRCEGSGCPAHNKTDSNTATAESVSALAKPVTQLETSAPQSASTSITPETKPVSKAVSATSQPATKTKVIPAERFGIFGSNTIGAELMPRLIEEYAVSQSADIETAGGAKAEESLFIIKDTQSNTLFEADLRAHGSGTSFPGLQSGEAEIGMASRAIKEKEIRSLQSQGIDNMREPGQEHVVALDGLIVIVSQNNPINQLSLSQVADLFSGKITNWSQVGGLNQPVTVYARDNQSGTFDTFKSLVLKPNKVKLAESARRFESNEALSDAVAADKGAVGFTGFAYARNAKPLALESECGMIIEPSVFNVKTEEYPLARRLYLYTAGKPMSSHAKGLLDFSLSDEAQDVIADVGFIEQTASLKPLDKNSDRVTTVSDEQPALFKQLVKQLNGQDRLSTTFRFRSGSADLDVKAIQDIKRIANALANTENQLYGRKVTLIGFADSVGGFASNQRLSKRRADSVLEKLAENLPQSITQNIKTTGYSELMPVACNTNEVGKNKNRRVEIWVR